MQQRHRLGISTISLGWHATHSLDEKLVAASQAGYEGIEMSWIDLEQHAKTANCSIEESAKQLKTACKRLKLEVIALVPFENFEGSPIPLATRLGLAHRWVNVARILDTEMIQVPANYDHASLAASDDDVIEELRLLADCGLSSQSSETTITFAYEPMAWSVRDNTWQAGLRTVRRVARPNFKLCLDTYHILAKIWGDCTSPNGKVPSADAALEASLHDLPRMIRADEIAFVQLSDGERMDPPLKLQNLNPGQHYSQYWCNWGRLFPFERDLGAYLPMESICRCFLMELGFQGWVSMETFHREMAVAENRPHHWTRRGVESWSAVKKAIGLNENAASQHRPAAKL